MEPVMTLPTFIVVGAMKAGTTSLHAYLGSHPEVFTSANKELDFFVTEFNWSRGLEWYRLQFEGSGSHLAVGESSPNYSKAPHFGGVPPRIAEVLPNVRLVYIVRHPIERIRSHVLHNRRHHGETRSLDEITRDPHYVACSSYSMQLDLYLEHFDMEQILVVTAESLRDARANTVARVLAHIGVDSSLVPPNLHEQLHRTPAPPQRRWRGLRSRRPPADVWLSETAREELHERLREDVSGLRRFLGSDFDGWDIG